MEQPGRKYSACSGYRYGFNGKENDNNSGYGNLDFGARIFTSRLGRWLSLDPLQEKYPHLSPYNFAANNPIILVDPDGRDIKPANPETSAILEEIKKNAPPILRSKIEILENSKIVYNINLFTSKEAMAAIIKKLKVPNASSISIDGITDVSLKPSADKNESIQINVRNKLKNGLDRKLVAINEIGEAYDYEVGNVGVAKTKNGNTLSIGKDPFDEFDQFQDMFEYAKKNNIEIPKSENEKDGMSYAYYRIDQIINAGNYQGRKEDIKTVMSDLGYIKRDSTNPETDVNNMKQDKDYTGTKYQYRTKDTQQNTRKTKTGEIK